MPEVDHRPLGTPCFSLLAFFFCIIEFCECFFCFSKLYENDTFLRLPILGLEQLSQALHFSKNLYKVNNRHSATHFHDDFIKLHYTTAPEYSYSTLFYSSPSISLPGTYRFHSAEHKQFVLTM